MVPIPETDSLEILNERILQECFAHGNHRTAGQQQTINELFEQETEFLLETPRVPFSNIQSYNRKADKYATVIIDKNRYSVPVKYRSLLRSSQIPCPNQVWVFGTPSCSNEMQAFCTAEPGL